jgi:glycosyltransferase involved in cell wall biosynthesis
MKLFYGAFITDEKSRDTIIKNRFSFNYNVHRYHLLLTKGLHSIFELNTVGFGPKNYKYYQESTIDQNFYFYSLDFKNNIKKILQLFQTIDKDSVLIADVLQLKSAVTLFLFAKIKKLTFISLVTDRPVDIFPDSFSRKVISNIIIKFSTGYIFVTNSMNKFYNIDKKPYTIISTVVELTPPNSTDINSSSEIMLGYSGYISRENRIDILIDALNEFDNVKLLLYGAIEPSYELEFNERCITRKINYYGVVDESTLIESLRKCHFLINPRNPIGIYTKYTYPIKTSFYLYIGIPFISTKLQGIPESHTNYINYVSFSNSIELMKILDEIFSLDYDAIKYKAIQGQKFIIENYNYDLMAKKVSQLIRNA